MNTQRIDIHHHSLPPEYIKELASIGVSESAGVQFPKWDPESSLAFMERRGIAAAILSVSAPGIFFGDIKFSRNLARKCNEFAADVIKEYPNRFGALAVLPLPDIKSSLTELEYALDSLNLNGVGLLSNYEEFYLGDPVFDDLLAELNRRKAVVFVHPNTLPEKMLPKTSVSPAIMEFVFNTTRVVANLIYSRSLRRFPDIRFIFPHAGGCVPYLAWRISMGSRGFIKQLKNLYFDIALSATPYSLPALQELAYDSHILFGSDFPFLPEPLITAQIEGFENYKGFTQEARLMIERENMLILFPQFK